MVWCVVWRRGDRYDSGDGRGAGAGGGEVVRWGGVGRCGSLKDRALLKSQ